MFMLGPKPMSFYDPNVKHGLGNENPYTLKKAVSQNPKLYDASCLGDSKIHVNIRDIEDILDDATKSQIKMKNKLKDPIAIEKKQNVYTTDYKKLNAFYEDFIPQKEFSTKQKYFSSSFISSKNPLNTSLPSSSSETKPTVAPMISTNPMILDLNKMENEFKMLFAVLQTNFKRESIFYTSSEEIRLINFCQQEVKPILHKLHLNFEIFQKRFLKDIKEMKDVFDSTESDLSATWKQNELLNESTLGSKTQASKLKMLRRDSIEIQERMPKQINFLENDVQRCQKLNLDFELQLQHEKERQKCESSLKNVCETSWISKIENLEKVRAHNQDLLIIISELKAKLKKAEKGLKAASSVRRPSNTDSSFKNSVLLNTKNSSEKVETFVRTNKKTYVASTNVVSNKKIVTDVDVKNALKAKDVLCVSCDKNLRDTTHVVSKTRFSDEKAQFKSLDTTLVVSKTKIAAVTPLSAKNKVSSASKTITVILQENSLSKYMKNKIRTSRMWQKCGCSKHMTGDRTLLKNFVDKFLGIVHIRNDHFAVIIGYGDYVQGNITVCHVYYVKGLGHNSLSSVGYIYDGDLEIAFRSKTCYVRNLEGDDLLIGARESNLYTISIFDMAASLLVCLLSKATSIKSWLWHRNSHI
ncbi:hypothetical protein Tco_0969908 [Tanacetum coccineum]